MEMKSPLSLPSAEDKSSFLTKEALSLAEAVAAVESKKHGAVATFLGCVRDREEGEPISAIHYEAYSPMADRQLAKIIQEAETKYSIKGYVCHRTGRVPVKEAAVVVACAAPHRQEAFAACAFIVEQLKTDVPIWKVHYEK